MNDRVKVYIAGPMSKGDIKANVKAAIDAGAILIQQGYAPMIPHLTHYVETAGHCFEHRVWLAVDLPWVAVADAVLRLPGDSIGAEMETDLAERLGIPVYYSVAELLDNPPKIRQQGDRSSAYHVQPSAN